MTNERLIFLNDNIISHSAQIGVKRFFYALADGVSAAFGDRVVVYSPERRSFGSARSIRARGIPGRMHNVLASAVAAWYRPRIYIAPYYGWVATRAFQVYLVHDMIYELLPQHFPARISYNQRFVAEKRRCLHDASLLIANSHSTARDVLALYPQVDPAKIVVAHLGVDERFCGQHAWPGEAPARPYLLYVGQRNLYKNFRRLLEAFGEAGLAASHDLRVISGGAFTADEREVIARYGLDAVLHLRSGVSDAELAAHYQHAVALVYPSEYEGFGLPVAEAMAAGGLVVTAERSSMPEVGGAAALYFDPTSVASMAAALRAVVALTPEERARRIAAGRERAASFTWDKFQATVNAAIAALVR